MGAVLQKLFATIYYWSLFKYFRYTPFIFCVTLKKLCTAWVVLCGDGIPHKFLTNCSVWCIGAFPSATLYTTNPTTSCLGLNWVVNNCLSHNTAWMTSCFLSVCSGIRVHCYFLLNPVKHSGLYCTTCINIKDFPFCPDSVLLFHMLLRINSDYFLECHY